jgi:PAS domain S-box-containing protein
VDSPAHAELILAVLKRAGYRLTTDIVSRPEEFEQRLRAKDYDIVLGDDNLVTRTGPDFLARLRATGKDIPVVVVTAAPGDEAAMEYLQRGAADYVLKHHLERLPAVIGQTLLEQAHRRQERALLEKLQCGKREWELTFDTVPDAVFLADGQCRIRRANQAARKLVGLPFVDVIGKLCHEVLGGGSQPILRCPQESRFAETELLQLPSPGNCPGKVFEATCAPVRDDSGRLLNCVHVLHDVTDRSEAERALRESERKYRELVENATYGVFRATPEGRLLEVNPALVAMLGYASKEEVLGLNLATEICLRPADRSALLRQFREEAPQNREDLCWKKKGGGTVLVRTSGRAVRHGAGQIQYYEAIAEDMTARRTLEAELRQSQKMEAMGRLAGGVAHDFNNLLAVILGSAELLLEPCEPPEKQRQRLEQIKKAAGRAAELTQRLLSFSRKQTLFERVFDINEVVKETVSLLRRILGEDILLVEKLSPVPERIRADQAQVEQTLMNLAANARDSMPNGGSLVIETSACKLDRPMTQLHGPATAGEYVVLTLRDTGVGMDEETRSRIFEPFFTTKEQGKGTGLGLAMVYGFVKQSRGFTHVDSEVGKGTTFEIYFPKVLEEGEEAAAHVRPAIVGGSETILLAEDEEPLRDLACELLQSMGYTVISADGGAMALERAQQASHRIDLLLTDAIMPGMSGRELVDRLTALRPGVKVIYMSGYANEAITRHDLWAPDAVFVPKPFTREQIAATIRRVLDDGGRPPLQNRTAPFPGND